MRWMCELPRTEVNHEWTLIMLNYLRITKLRVGVILNFKRPTLEWERIVL